MTLRRRLFLFVSTLIAIGLPSAGVVFAYVSWLSVLERTERDGILIECSCSHHMPREALLEGIQLGGRHLDRFVQVLEPLSQTPDHPVHPAIPETDYLKGFITRVLPA